MPARDLPKTYEPKEHEPGIYGRWEEGGFFDPDQGADPEAAGYAIVMPPPNVTGTLHVGHAVMLAIEDILVRYHRMRGERALWLPGTDHAAIATQTKVEKALKEEGTDRHQLGREKFLRRVEDYARQSHDTIVNQVRRIGSSCDWSREAYTLDETRTKAVRAVFKMMYDDGLIYRGERIVNWCPRCHSTLADDEVEYEPQKAKLYTFRYAADFPFAIATTRPETKLGDTAVAVNPKDKRYRDYVGREYTVDFAGVPLCLKIIAEREVDADFGTGALGVTPAHSAADAQMAERHGLKTIKVIDEDGRIREGFGEYAGKTAEEARAMIAAKLREAGLLEKEEDIENNLSVCYRCGTPVEPLPSLQWFIDVNKKLGRRAQGGRRQKIEWSGKSIKDIALGVVKSGQIRIIPERFEKNYYHWMENLRDWCISRQIWFGHRVPVWYGIKKPAVSSRKYIDLNFRDRKMFAAIKAGRKTIETRALNPEEKDRYFGDIGPGELLALNYLEDNRVVETVLAEVRRAHNYKTIEGMLEKEEAGRIVPGGTGEDVRKFYLSLPDYPERIEKNGLAAIEIGSVRPAGAEKVYLTIVRHGQTDWNLNGIMQGQTDVPLNGKGKEDARKLAAKVGREMFDIVITSPLKRTSETARLLNACGAELIEDDRLKERYYGKFEGMKTAEVLAAHPEIKTFEVNGLPYWIDVPTAESYGQVRSRVEDFLADVRKKYAGKRVLVVSHGDTLDMFYAVLNNLPDEKAYGRFSLNMRLEKYELDAGGADGGGEIHVGIEPPAGKGWTQDEDTLDTWFSSGLWTFSTLARTPEEIRLEGGRLAITSDDFKSFHPTAVLETGYDILFFWVARMIIMTTYAVGDIPFRDVYLHGLVRDAEGRKMSKSLGNVIDPLDMIEKYGADATRLSLVIGTTPGNDMNLSEAKIAGYRNFVNKLWNIARYITPTAAKEPAMGREGGQDLTAADVWILSKFEKLISEVTGDLDHYRLSQAGERLREFTWNDLADWYVEASKFEPGGAKGRILKMVLNDLLKLWHPFMPFVTEAINAETGGREMLITSPWPRAADYKRLVRGREKMAAAFEKAKEIITAIRNLRAEYRIKPGEKIKAVVYAGPGARSLINQLELIKRLRTGLDELIVEARGGKIENAVYGTAAGAEIYLRARGLDPGVERERTERELKETGARIEAVKTRLADREFTSRAPERVVAAEKEKLGMLNSELDRLKKRLEHL